MPHLGNVLLKPALGTLFIAITSVTCPRFSFAASPAEKSLPGNLLSEYRHQAWTSDDGLPSNLVNAILQTRDGYVWIGTSSGLVRFDGVKFTIFNRVNSPEMVSDECWSLAEDRDGNLWVGTSDALLRRRDHAFTRFTAADGLLGSGVNALAASHDGSVWAGTDRGVNRFLHGSWRRFSEADGLDKGPVAITSIKEDQAGMVWVCGSKGIYHFDPKTEKFTLIEGPNRHRAGVHSCSPNSQGQLWVAFVENSSSHACLHLRTGGHWSECGEYPVWTVKRQVFMGADRKENLWFGTSERGLTRLREGEPTHFNLPDVPAGESGVCMFEDREGGLWFGAAGLHRLQPLRIRAYGMQSGLLEPNVWTFCPSRDGSVWVGMEAGLNRLKDGMVVKSPGVDSQPSEVRSLAEDAAGNLWVGTREMGVGCVRDGRLTMYPLPGEVAGNEVRSLAFAPDGTLWVGAGQGLYRWRADQAIAPFTPLAGLPTNDVRAVLTDRTGNLWIGLNGAGARRLSPQEARVSSRPDPNRPLTNDRQPSDATTPPFARSEDGPSACFTTKEGLSSDFVTTLYEDREGVLWIGTQRGLNRLSIEESLTPATEDRSPFHRAGLTSFTARHGLADEMIKQILEDDLGNLWYSGERGIYRIGKQELDDVAAGRSQSVTPVAYGSADGILGLANGLVSEPAGCKTRDGRLWFATTKGAVVIDPKDLPDNRVAPPVVIEQVIADNVLIFNNRSTEVHAGVAAPVKARTNNDERRDAQTSARQTRFADQASKIKLRPGSARILEFQYTASSFIDPQRIRFRYKLDGYDDDWREAGTRRVAYYANLKPGEHLFRVMACNNHNVWNETGAVFAFYLAPHFYQTGWFSACCLVAVLGSAYGVHCWKLGFARRIEQQTTLILERQRIARDMHDDLSAGLSKISRLSQIALENQPQDAELQGPVKRIATLADQMVNNIRDVVWTTSPEFDTLDNLVAYIRENAAQILDSTAIEAAFRFPDGVEPRRLPSEFRRHLLLIAKEALQNVVKHSGARRVEIRLVVTGEMLELSVDDNGRGFDPGAGRSSGNGLLNMRHRAGQLLASFKLHSRPGDGTRIILKVPLPRI